MKKWKVRGIKLFVAVIAMLGIVVLPALAADRANYTVNTLGIGDPIVTITATGTEINALDGGVAGTIVASKVIVADTNGALADADLLLESTNEINVTIGAVSMVAMDDAAIATNAAAADTTGKSFFLETQDGGVDTAVDGGSPGGPISTKSGDGSAGGTDNAGGAGGAYTSTSGVGGAGTGTNAAGAAAGTNSVVASVGGASVGTGVSGAGGPVAITAGNAGASAGSGNGGVGGTITATPGTGGTSGSGSAGAPGKFKIASGMFEFTNAQTLDMSDAQVALTLVPGTPVGTLLTSNVLYADPNSGEASEDLLLPPEADSDGLEVIIANNGGETLVVKEDGDSVTIATVLAGQTGLFVCDGTTWQGGNILQGVTSSEAELNLLDASVVTEPADAAWAQAMRWARAEYDFATDGGTVGAIGLGVNIPDNAIIVLANVENITTLTSSGDTATMAISVEGADDIVVAIAINDASNPWDALDGPAIAVNPVESSTQVKTTSAQAITATVAVENVTAGKFYVNLGYIIGE